MPWPSGFDRQGRLWGVGGLSSHFGPTSRLVVRDSAFTPIRSVPFPDLELPVSLSPSEPIWDPGPGGDLWLARDDRFRLYRRRPTGDTVRIVERNVSREPRSEEEKEDARSAADERMRRVGKDPSSLPDQVHGWKPLMEALWIGDGGRLWIAPPIDPDERMVYRLTVFGGDGRFLGDVRSEFGIWMGSPSPVIRNDRIYAVTVDEMDVQYVVRGRIVRPGGDGGATSE